MILSAEQRIRLTRATVLAGIAADALSTFEMDTITEVAQRRDAFGADVRTTAQEWAVIDQALTAMECWLRGNWRRLRIVGVVSLDGKAVAA